MKKIILSFLFVITFYADGFSDCTNDSNCNLYSTICSTNPSVLICSQVPSSVKIYDSTYLCCRNKCLDNATFDDNNCACNSGYTANTDNTKCCQNCVNAGQPGLTCTISGNNNSCTYTTSCASGYTISGNGTVNASCAPNSITINLNKNGWSGILSGGNATTLSDSGGTSNATQTFTGSFSTYTLPTVSGLTKTGYNSYGGWGTAANCTSANSNFSSITNNETYYICWQANTYTINFDKNDNLATGTTASANCTYGTNCTLTSNGFSKTGHSFANWTTNPNGTGTSYSDGASVSNLVSTNNGSITLYAKWTPNVYAITLNDNGGNGGSGTIYEKYGIGFYSDANANNPITSVSIPQKSGGYIFNGYFSASSGGNIRIPNTGSLVLLSNTIVSSNEIWHAQWTQCGDGNYINGTSCASCEDGKYCPGDGTRHDCKKSFNHSGTNPNEDNIAHNTDMDCYVSASKACGTNGCFTLPGNANTLRYWTNHSSDKEIAGLARNDSVRT